MANHCRHMLAPLMLLNLLPYQPDCRGRRNEAPAEGAKVIFRCQDLFRNQPVFRFAPSRAACYGREGETKTQRPKLDLDSKFLWEREICGLKLNQLYFPLH